MIKRSNVATATAFTLIIFSALAYAEPMVIYDISGKFDKSFSEAVYRDGVERYNADKNTKVKEFEPQNEAQREQGLRRLASRSTGPIVAVGFSMAPAVEKIAAEYPDTKFTIIDAVVDKPNVQSVIFREDEGAFLVGALAALKTKTGKVSFVGGMDTPLIHKFNCGYQQGVNYINPKIEVLSDMTGPTLTAFNDATKGAELALGQFAQGSDIVFAAAGSTGLGVYQAAKDNGKLAIGVDANQNHLHPGTMLTSMIKNVGLAAYNSWDAEDKGTWKSGIVHMSVADGGISWAYDENNQGLITPEMKQKMEQIKADIISGKIKVHNYMDNNACTY